MTEIQKILRDPSWDLKIELDANEKGDGPHIRLIGDPNTFRTLATFLNTMAESVDTPTSPMSDTGWHLALANELPQLTIENASLVVFDCRPNADTNASSKSNS